MTTDQQNLILPRFRVYGNIAEFETERHLEWFFWHTVLTKLGLKPLASQYSCREGICDILARGIDDRLIIIELKNTQDSHVIEQITAYFDALHLEKPFSEEVDYSKPITLYTVCPSYSSRTVSILKYHKLDFTVLAYIVKSCDQVFRFTLWDWFTNEEIVQIEIPSATEIPTDFNLPDPPKSYVDLLRKCSDDQKHWAIQTRDQIYQFAQSSNFKISETPDGKSTRFERTKLYPIVEMDWDNKRDTLAIYLWLPFTTVNGRINMMRETYKKTSMMRLWIVDGEVEFLAYVENKRKSWLVFTKDELENQKFPRPTKMRGRRYGEIHYWEGLAMPTQFYLETMGMIDKSHSLSDFVALALDHALKRYTKSQSSRKTENITKTVEP
ncbi:DUF91 domain-containing protein [Tumidithrix helvetica PCC 7403]|uniref:endonuclease NucS domain-containing protein n=1 Tax=Tumidithrix helvetica TaxID=3457545 RepID=UPI003CC48FF1